MMEPSFIMRFSIQVTPLSYIGMSQQCMEDFPPIHFFSQKDCFSLSTEAPLGISCHSNKMMAKGGLALGMIEE